MRCRHADYFILTTWGYLYNGLVGKSRGDEDDGIGRETLLFGEGGNLSRITKYIFSPAGSKSTKCSRPRLGCLVRSTCLCLSISHVSQAVGLLFGTIKKQALKGACFFIVPKEGIEPSPLARHDFESCASTNSATSATQTLFYLMMK